jgi:hypothetical protein
MAYGEHNIFNRESGALWKDENFDLASMSGASSLPDPVTLPGTSIQALAFDGNNTLEQVFGCKEINHDYKEGTVISPHVHWYPSTTATTNVKWNMEYYARNANQINTVISGTLSVIATASGGAYTQRMSVFPDLNLGALAKIGTQVHFRFYRNPADTDDTYPSDAVTATFGWHYQTNSRGSSQIGAK